MEQCLMHVVFPSGKDRFVNTASALAELLNALYPEDIQRGINVCTSILDGMDQEIQGDDK